MEKWKGKLAVVTWAESPVGEAIVNELLRYGVRVVALDSKIERLESLEKSQTRKSILKVIQCDFCSEAQIRNTFFWIKMYWGTIQILINIPNILYSSSLIDGSADDWESMLKENVVGMSLCTREATMIMCQAKIQGHIINVNSVAGGKQICARGLAMFSASMHAIKMLTSCLKTELLTHEYPIKVTNLSFGGLTKDKLQPLKLDMNDGKILPEDVSDAVIYALSTRINANVTELTVEPVGQYLV